MSDRDSRDPREEPDQGSIARWKTVSKGALEHHGIFAVQSVVRRSTRTGKDGRYKVIHLADWANVVALTADDQIVLVEQYRHGTDSVTLEIPGGVVESQEPPAKAAARELLEETGFAGSEPVLIGSVLPNPAIQTNTCTTWLIREARRVAEPSPDEGEHLEVVTVPRREVPAMLAAGRINHSLVVAAFHWLALHLEKHAG